MRFEVTYLVFAPVTLFMLVFFALVDWLRDKHKVAFWVVGVPFAILDVIYNVVIGSLLFMEWPREWLFTTRLKRHVGDWRVERFARVLNKIDAGHV